MARSKPPIFSKTHPLPFDLLAPGEFERLCLWLVRREGYERAEHLGASGHEQGRDIVAWRGDAQWAFQCKRVLRLSPGEAEGEVDKVLGLPEAERPVGLVFLVSGNVSDTARRRARARCAGQIACDFCAATALDERVKRHPDVMKEFFGVPAVHPGLLPSRPDLFVGRDEAMAHLRARLAGDGEGRGPGGPQVLTAVRGWPGVGKTTLAQALAHDPAVRQALPDGVLWAALGPHPDVMGELLKWGRALGMAEALAECPTAGECSDRLRARLRDARALLLVDDVWDADEGRIFDVGGAGCRALFTTRLERVARALAPRRADRYCLGTLNDGAARALLAELAPAAVDAHPEKVSALVRAADGLPLALKLAGKALAADPGWGLEGLLAALKTREGRLALKSDEAHAGLPDGVPHSVGAIFGLSIDRLEPETRARFALLGAMAPRPATFDLPAAAALWGVGEPEAQAALRTLWDHGLVEVDAGRVQIHATLADYAAGLAGDRLPAARTRLARHYLVLAWEQDPRLDGPDYQDALAVLDSEYPNVRSARAWAVESADRELVQGFAHAASDYQGRRNLWQDRLGWAQKALAACEHMDDPGRRSGMLVLLGTAYADLPTGDRGENLERAIGCYGEALRVYTPEAAPLDYAMTQNNLGNAYADLPTGDRGENLERAIGCYGEALRFRTPEAAPLDYAMTQNNLGNAYVRLPTGDRGANLERAIGCYQEALAIEYLAPWSRARYLRNLGDAHGELGEYAAAAAAYEQAVALTPDDPYTYARLGHLARALEDYAAAVAHYTAAIDRDPEAEFYFDRGLAHLALGQPDRALADYRAAVPGADPATLAETLEELDGFAAGHPDTPGLDAVRALFPQPGTSHPCEGCESPGQ